MASNDTSLADGDGCYPDWIELFNPTDTTIHLGGWCLTDSMENLDKWTFPSVPPVPQEILDLTPGEYLVVFASGQETDDYIDAGGNLHTNFKLNSDCEYLALIDPFGSVAHAYAPEYPPQSSDISYGLAMESSDVMLVGMDTNLHYLIPTNGALGTSWTGAAFNDDSWMGAAGEFLYAGIGYEDNPTNTINFTSLLETTVASGTTSLYTRFEFDVADPQAYNTLILRMMYDDGFIAYLNGIEVARDYFSGTPRWDSTASGGRGDSIVIEDFVEFDITSHLSELLPGSNVLAIHCLNTSSSSTDMLMITELHGGMAGLIEPLDPGYFRAATPNTANGPSFSGFVGDTQFSVDRGFYTSAFDVEITTETDGATIVYTTDGSVPVVDNAMNLVNGFLYTGPIRIDSTTTLRAAAFKLDYQPTNTDTHTYIFLADILLQSPAGEAPDGFPSTPVNGQVFDYGMDPNIVNDSIWGPQLIDALTQIPTISFVTDLDNLFDPSIGIYVNATRDGRLWERPTSVELINPDNSGGFQIDAGLRIRGGFSRGDFNPKHSFRLLFRSDYGDAKLRFPLFDDEGADTYDAVDLRTAQNYAWSNDTFNDQLQNTFLRDIYSRDVQREQGQAYTRGRYYHLYINGQYWGLYQTEERPEASYASTYFGGNPDDWDAMKASSGQIEATDGDLAAWTTLANLAVAGFTTDAAYYFVQGKNPDGSDNPAFEKHVDLDNLIDFMIGVFFTGNQDMPTALGNNGPNNFWAIRPRDGSHGWRWIAHDNEHNLGTSRDGDLKDDNVYYDGTIPTSAGSTPLSFNPKYLHQQLMAHPEYLSRFADRVQRYFFNGGLMTTAGAQALLDSRSLQIDQAIIAESARWGDQHNEPPLTWDTWQTEVDWLRNTFLSQRSAIVLNQLRADGLYPSGQLDAPSFSQHGGSVPSGFQLGIVNHESTGTV
ncbi:MAG: CotH kinase family protein, partial [Pirellulales bacterium]|nr:CotH kinase family protein [Pirellulales bacterium]